MIIAIITGNLLEFSGAHLHWTRNWTLDNSLIPWQYLEHIAI